MQAIKDLRDRHKESKALFQQIDANGDNRACHRELSAFVASNAPLWLMLRVNLGLPEDRCRAVATRVVMELASGKQGREALAATITPRQFHAFWHKYVHNAKGAQEFFHRCVFCAFDADHNSYLDPHELEDFLEQTFYHKNSIFHGDVRLPQDKAAWKRVILEKYSDEKSTVDNNNNNKQGGGGGLTFESIRGLISGNHDAIGLLLRQESGRETTQVEMENGGLVEGAGGGDKSGGKKGNC